MKKCPNCYAICTNRSHQPRSLGLPSLVRVTANFSNRRVRTRTHGGVAGVSGQPLPLCRSNRLTGQNSETG